jgi:rare lipoprotein A
MWGRDTACGETLRPKTLGVAHKSLPCGTTVKFVYRGRALITRVIDRGPYVSGRAWDLTQAASEALGFEGVGQVRYAIATNLARQSP